MTTTVEVIVWISRDLAGEVTYSASAQLVAHTTRVKHTLHTGISEATTSEFLAVREALRDLWGRVSEDQRPFLATAIANPLAAITERRER